MASRVLGWVKSRTNKWLHKVSGKKLVYEGLRAWCEAKGESYEGLVKYIKFGDWSQLNPDLELKIAEEGVRLGTTETEHFLDRIDHDPNVVVQLTKEDFHNLIEVPSPPPHWRSNTREAILEEKGSAIWNRKYEALWNVRTTRRTIRGVQVQPDRDLDHRLDRERGIDKFVHLQNEGIISIQEKVRAHEQLPCQSVNISLWKNQNQQRPGDWQTCVAQLYAVGYMNQEEDDFAAWIILDLAALAIGSSKGDLDGWESVPTGEGLVRFIGVCEIYDQLPHSIVASYGFKGIGPI
jgi:hypothetical protein